MMYFTKAAARRAAKKLCPASKIVVTKEANGMWSWKLAEQE